MTKTAHVIALSSSARTFYEANPVTEDVKSLLEETAVFLIGVTRRSTEEAFELGERLERAAALLPEGTLEKWAVERCGYTARHVRTQRAVFRNLARYKDILVELAVGPTVLGKLSAAEPEQIEQAIGFAVQNGKLRVQDVGAIMAGSKSEAEVRPQVDPYDVGGLDGLKAIIAIKVRDGIKAFIGHLEMIRAHVNEALPKKNIVKKTLAEKTHLTARLAHRELQSLAEFVVPYPSAAYVISPSALPAKTGWARVSALLYKMGSEMTWPDKAELRTWLETEVAPVLEWATSKAIAPAWPGAETREASNTNVPAEVDANKSGPAVVNGSDGPGRANTASVEERLKTIAAAFSAEAAVEPPGASSPILPDDSIPTLSEALAEPPKAFKRPAFLGPKAAANKPNDGTASAA
ncbi:MULTISPECIES: hypothetical protein [unclassified Rhizobium]|uniref:hypothetical protein n=1 Tax=unclassified Rhizobium TaxID=2613769 RepID=UPI000BE96F22|nr:MULTISPECIES: hypothetical protein [unclassified Rhizobium]MDF0660827.1 hypothetical protein [Rhizobium sp. BC49]PDS85508.1 hypothetical protein CO654_10595 [Rhizobium sp. L18]